MRRARAIARVLVGVAGLAAFDVALISPVLAQARAPAAVLSQDAQDAIKKGILAAKEQDFPLAIRFFQDARKASPDAPEIYYEVVVAQAAAGDIADAQSYADLIQEREAKNISEEYIAEAQAKAGDVAGAKKTADSIQDDEYRKNGTRKAIADAQAKAGATNVPVATASPAPVAQAPVQPVVRVLRVTDWLDRLNDNSADDAAALNTDLFLDLANSLNSLPQSDDPDKKLDQFLGIVRKIDTAQTSIDKMLKQQAKERAASTAPAPPK